MAFPNSLGRLGISSLLQIHIDYFVQKVSITEMPNSCGRIPEFVGSLLSRQGRQPASGGQADSAQAYVGPGVGLGALGVLLGVVGGVLLAIFGFFWYPIKRMLKRSSDEPEIVLESEEVASPQASESLSDDNRQWEHQTSSEPS